MMKLEATIKTRITGRTIGQIAEIAEGNGPPLYLHRRGGRGVYAASVIGLFSLGLCPGDLVTLETVYADREGDDRAERIAALLEGREPQRGEEH